jgi:hypothetical protein
MPIKTFRGKIAMGAQDKMSLHTNNGSTGYRIRKFQILSSTPGTTSSVEYVFKIYTISQTTIDAVVDLSDPTLLAVAYYQDRANASSASTIMVFDNMVFNQDIFITAEDADSNTLAGNYYIELEQLRLDGNENTVATLKDIRNVAAQAF